MRFLRSLFLLPETLRRLESGLSRGRLRLAALEAQGVKIMANVDALKAEITRNGELLTRTFALVQKVLTDLENIEPTQTAIDEMVADLKSETDELQALLDANAAKRQA